MKSRKLWWCRIWVALLLSAGNLAMFAIDIWPIPFILAVFLMATCLCLRTEQSLKKYGNWICLWILSIVLLYLNIIALMEMSVHLSKNREQYSWVMIALLPLYFVYSFIVTTGSFLILHKESAKWLNGVFYTYYNFSLRKVRPGVALAISIALLEVSGLTIIGIIVLLTKFWLFCIFPETVNYIAIGVFGMIWLIFLLIYFIYRKRYLSLINLHDSYDKLQYAEAAVVGPIITIILAILYVYIPTPM